MNIHGSYQVSCNPTKKVVAEEERVWIHGKSRSGFPLGRRVRVQCLRGCWSWTGVEGALSAGLCWLACPTAWFSSLVFSARPCSEAPRWWPSNYTLDLPTQIARPMGELMSVCKVVCRHWIKCSCTAVKCLEKDDYSQHLLCCQKPLLTRQRTSPCPHSSGRSWHALVMFIGM